MMSAFVTKRFRIAVVLALSSISPALAAGQTPDATVSELYAAYGQGCDHAERNGLDDALAKRLFDPDLARIYRKAKSIDADFFVAGQDWCITAPVAVAATSQSQSKASMVATVTLDDAFSQGKPRIRTLKIKFDLSHASDGWRISDAFDGAASAKQTWRRP
jgi:hypothetical protein